MSMMPINRKYYAKEDFRCCGILNILLEGGKLHG